jgi:hypothetical protein
MSKAAVISLAISVGSLLGAAPVSAQDYEVQKLVDRHEAGRELVATVEATMDLYQQQHSNHVPAGKSLKYLHFTWAKNGPRERIQEQAITHPEQGDMVFDSFADYFVDGKTLSSLRKFNPDDPPKILTDCRKDIGCSIEPQTRKVPDDPAVFLVRRISLPLGVDGSWTLRELVQASPKVSLLAAQEVAGHRCPGLRIEHPGIKGTARTGTFAEVFLDPQANYAIRQVREHVFSEIPSPHPAVKPQESVSIRTVKQFRDFGKGIHFPEETELTLPNGTVRTVVTSLKVNEPLSSGALAFHFPKFAQVTYLPAVDGRYKVVVWGDENKPLREIFGPDDVRKIYEEFHLKRESRYETKTLQ